MEELDRKFGVVKKDRLTLTIAHFISDVTLSCHRSRGGPRWRSHGQTVDNTQWTNALAIISVTRSVAATSFGVGLVVVSSFFFSFLFAQPRLRSYRETAWIWINQRRRFRAGGCIWMTMSMLSNTAWLDLQRCRICARWIDKQKNGRRSKTSERWIVAFLFARVRASIIFFYWKGPWINCVHRFWRPA